MAKKTRTDGHTYTTHISYTYMKHAYTYTHTTICMPKAMQNKILYRKNNSKCTKGKVIPHRNSSLAKAVIS